MTNPETSSDLVKRLRQTARDFASNGIAEEAATTIERLTAERDEARNLAERLKLEAQGHAMEARTANATIYEIYQVVSGATGEPGNWHGAEPVRERFAALSALNARQAKALKEIDGIARQAEIYATGRNPKLSAGEQFVKIFDLAHPLTKGPSNG